MSSTPQDQYLAVCKELERLNHDIGRYVAIAAKQAQEMEELRADLAAARSNADRYRWLRTNKLMHNGEAWTWATGNGRTILTLPDLDAAIDAALAGEKK